NFGMSQHGLTLVAAAHQRDGGPERAHRFKVRRPVFNLGFEDRSQNRVVPHVRVKRMDEIADHWLGDTGGGAGRSGIWFAIEIWRRDPRAHSRLHRIASNVNPTRMATGIETIWIIASDRLISPVQVST